MIHIDDLVTGLCLAMDTDAANGSTYVVTDGQPYSTRQIYESICVALGKSVPGWHIPWLALVAMAGMGDGAARLLRRPVPFDSDALDKLLGSAWYEARRAPEELGFEPQYTLYEAMPEIVRSLRPADSDL